MTDIFSIKGFKFPDGFLWGSASAGHQIEGNNIHSNWWHLEQKNKNAGVPGWECSELACNSYEMYEEDSRILKELGHQVYRLSMEWSRIEPNEGEFHPEELDHYIKVFEDLQSKGIKINLTLVHFAVPQWFEEKNGFADYENNLKYWERYLNYVLPKVSKYVHTWCVMNEFNLKYAVQTFDYKFNCVRFHARAYHMIKQYSSAPVSTAHAFVQYFAKRQSDKFDLALQNYYDCICNEYWFHAIRTGELILPYKECVYDKEIKDSCDYWAVNSYKRQIVDARVPSTRVGAYPFTKVQMINKENFYLNEFNPECLIHNYTRLKDKPVFITENGVSSDNDEFRIAWLVEYLCAVKECMNMGVDIMGYLYWSLLDNYEWGSYTPRFGLVDVDRNNNFKRTIKPSAYFFKEIIENNGYNPEMLEKYLKHAPRL
ncbi:MAG: glycoside hydrolase family 1 protein [Clostridiales bacterium]|nr:glycoside hydrolase family 1 protein [Clostridiales bacterium]